MKKAAPLPIFRTLAKSALHRIPMNITQFLHELGIATYIVVVISLLPEVFGIADQPPRYTLLKGLHRFGQSLSLGLAQQKVHVFRHDDISINAKLEAPTYTFHGFFEDSTTLCGPEQDTAMIATERYKMALPGVMKTLESGRHA
jgi:hypothetical protein